MLSALEKLSVPDLAALAFLALILLLCLVVFPCYLAFVAATGCGPRRVQSVCSYILRLAKRRSKFNYHQIIPHVYLGSLPRSMEDLEELKSLGVSAMVTLNEAWEMELSNRFVRDGCGIEHLHLPTPDFFAPKQEDIEAAVQFITAFVRKGMGVYVHCNGGKGRSAVCVICFMVSFMDLSPELAYDQVISKRRIAPMRGTLGLHKQWRAVKRFCRRIARTTQRFEAFKEKETKETQETKETRETSPEITAKPQELAVHVAPEVSPMPSKSATIPENEQSPGPTGEIVPPYVPEVAIPVPLNVPPEAVAPDAPYDNHASIESSDSDEEPPLLE